jgi:tape measure domain-containing protein|nr:MAG TPA: tail tape measure protein [Siphoviridae sp. ctIyp7]
MPKLVFKIAADYEAVIRLRDEISKLEAQLKKMDVNKSPAAAKALETQLASTRQQMMGLVTEAAKAGAVMENDLKNGIYNASQTVNNFTQKIIDQKRVIKDVEHDVKRLGDAYKIALKRSPTEAAGLLSEYQSAKKVLDEEKATLFGLTQQQAEARLSVKRLKDEYAAFKEEAGETVEANKEMSVSLSKVLGLIGGVTALKNFVTELVNVRGQFQQLEIAFTTMLKSKEKADKLMSELVDIAAKTPFDLQGVASSAKQMLAYGSSAENVGDELVMLGNVAAGVGSQLSEIAYLYGTLRTQGRAYAVDIRQFAGRGIPIYEELAKVLGVTKDEVSGLVTEGKVGFKEVEQAFKNMTSESGIYYNLMEEQSKSLTGQLSNLGDAWDTMLNEIGKDTQGIASAGISGLKGLIENYETIGKILVGLIAVYGTYKTALFVARIAQDTLTARMEFAILVTKAQTVAQKALNTVMKANPYAVVATTIVAISMALLNSANSMDKCQKGIDAYNKSVEEATKKEAKHREEIEKLLSVAQDEQSSTEDRKEALIRLEQKYPDIFKKYKTEADMLRDILNIKKQINEEDEHRKQVADEEELQRLNAEIEKLNKAIKSASQSGAGLSVQSLVNERSNLVKQRDLKQEEVNKKKHDKILSNLSGYSNEQLQKEVEVRERLMKRLENAQKLGNSVNNAKVSNGILPGIKTSEQLQAEKQAIERELGKRETPSSYQEDLAKAKETWEKAKKGYEDILKDQKATSEQVKKAREEMEAKEKAYKELGGVTGTSLTKQENQAKKDAERQKKERQQLYDELLQLRFKNQQDEINLMKEDSEKKRRQIELDYQKEIDAYNKAKAKYGETDEVKQMKTNAENKHKQSLYSVDLEQLQSEKKTLNSYLQEYGTFQQRKYAIAQEYADRIAKAQSDAEKALLGKERDSKLAGMETEALKKNIDWVTVFGEFGGMFSDIIRPVLEDAKRYMQTDGFKTSDASSQQAIVDAVNQMEKSLGGAEGLNFKKLGEDIQTYQNAVVSLNLAKEQEAEALERLAKAQEDYKNALENGTEEQKNAAKEALTNARNNADLASANVQMQTENAEKAQQGMSDTATRLKTNMDNVTQGLQKLASGGLSSIYDGLIQAGKGIGGAASKVSKKLEEVPVVGWIVSIIDVFKDGLSNVVGGLLDAVFNAVSGIIDDVFSGDLFVTIGESLLTGIGKILDAITFGGFSSWLGSGESDEHLKEDVERLTQSNQDLKMALDNLAEKMEDSAVADAPELYEQQKKNIQQSMANTQEMMRRSGAAYSNGFLGMGGTHSSNKRVNDAMSSTDWERISKVAGTTVRDVGDFWNLTSEQMYNVLMGAGDLYSKIKSYADDGHENAAQYMDEYISYWKQLEELEEAYYEKLTSISFDTVRDDFKSILLDMESDTKDFAESFEKMMQEAIIESMISDTYAKKLKDWYKNFADSMEDDGSISKDEQNSLKQQWDEMVNAALAERDMLIDSMGWDTSSKKQSATSKGYATASQDSIDELSGRTTAMYESNLRIEAAEQQQTIAITELRGSITALISQNSSLYNIADETRTILANSYLELQQIRENTGEIIKPIKKMQADIAEVKQNTSRL